MPHADQTMLIKARHDGVIPATWGTGNTDYQKAKVIAAVAWHNTKAPDDPELTACDLAHQEKCTAITESIIGGNEPDLTPFALEVQRLWLEVKPTKENTTNA